MASSTSGLPVVAAPNPPTFSYAQAAKGRATNTATSAIQSSQGTSGISTPAKDAMSSTSTRSASINGAGGSDSGERSVNGNNDVVTGADTPAASLDFASKSTTLVDANSSPSSPSFGTASTSTLPKDEELNLTAHPTPASVWDRVDRDRRAQAASALDRPSEPQEGRKGKNRKGAKREKAEAAERERAGAAEKEKEATKPEIPLVAAPLPTVNIWQQRMATQPPKAKANHLATQTQHENADVFQPAKPVDSKRRAKIPGAEAPEKVLGPTPNGGVKESAAATKVAKKGSDVKEETSNKRAGTRGSRSLEKDERASQLPPPVEDAVSWPTPETALEEEKRKAKVHVQEKPEKEEKDETASNKAQPKQKWHPVPFTPSVTFNTPLPQRGGRGRGGGRGGREAGSRGSHISNGSIGGDKPLPSATSTNPPTEVGERGRDNPSLGRAASLPPSSSAKPSSDGSQITGDQRKSAVVQTGEKPKAGPPNSSSKGEPRFVTDARLSNGAASESALETQKSDNTKAFMQDQTQSAAFDNQFNLSRAERRSESNIRGSEQMKDNTAFSRDGQQARDGRADRGRGGYRGRGGFPNGQHPQHGFANGHGPSQSNGYTLRQNGPYSPPLQPPFSNQPYVQTPSRGRGGNTRSQSIPNVYGARYPNGNGSIAPLQTSGSMYDYPPMQPMSAMPYSYVDTPNILQLLRIQIAYYFSLDNLLKDTFLRNHMDSQGFVLLSFIAGFRRIEALTHDFELLRFACQDCENVEIIKGEDNEDRLRRKEGWEHWVMPIEDRDESAKCEGPKFHYRVQRNQPMGGSHAMSPQPFSPNGNESGFQQFPAVGAVPLLNGNGQVLQTERLSAAVPEFAPAGLPAMNGFSGLNGINGTNVAVDPLVTDTQFTDEEVFNLTLVFNPVAKASDESKSKPFHHASSRTFSNGSIDGGTIDKINDEFRQGQGLTNGSHTAETSPNSNGPATSSSNPQTPTSATNGNGPRVMWKKGQKQQAPIPEENTEESYLTTREKALRSREVAPVGETPVDMKVLYEFWSHFLCRNFNPTMYREFRQFALEDLSQRNTMDGINNLISYYDETLNNKKKTIPEIIAQHYIELVKSEDASAERPAFSKLRAALQGSSIDMKSRKRIEQFIDPDSDLKAELER